MATPTTAGSSASKGNPGGNKYIAVQSTFVGIATFLVIIRFYVRSTVVKKLGFDDAMIVLALALSLVVLTLGGVSVHKIASLLAGHYTTKAAKLHAVTEASKLNAIAPPIGIIAGLCTRLSICLFLLRIYSTKREWKWGLYGVMAFATVSVIPTVVVLLAQCSPMEKLWDMSSKGSCWPRQTVVNVGYFNGAVSVLCDWTLATLPIVFMWNIQMKTRVKVGICLLMGMGYFTGICAVVRTALYSNARSRDVTSKSTSIDSAIWATLEINVGIIAASIPTLKPLFNPNRSSIFRSSIFRSLLSRRTSNDTRKASEKNSTNNTDDRKRLSTLTLGNLPSAIPSAFSSLRTGTKNRGKGWDDLESQTTMSSMEKAHVANTDRGEQNGLSIEMVGDGEVHATGENRF